MNPLAWRLTMGCAVAAQALAAGCAAQRVSGVPREATPPARHAGATACAFTIGSIDDRRDAPDLGQIGPTRVDGEGFEPWFRNALASMPGHTHEPHALAIRVTVLKAYVHGLATLKSANLVVRVHYPAEASGGAATKTYRGFDESMNWSNSETEIQAAFDLALRHLTDQIADDLKLRCAA